MFEQFTMSKKCVLLRDIKNYLKKLACGQLEIEAGQWELHKDILTMRKMFDELKNLKEDFEQMKKYNEQQMEIIRKLESAIYKKGGDSSPKKKADSNKSDEIFKPVPKKMGKNFNKDPKKKTHVVQSEEIIEITSHVESNASKSVSNCKSEGAEDRKGMRQTKAYLKSPIRSIVYFRKHTSGSGGLNAKNRIPPKKKDTAMLQRYLNDSAKFLDKGESKAAVEVSKSTENSKTSIKEVEQGKSDSWKCVNTKSRFSNSRDSDRSSERSFMSDNAEKAILKTQSNDKKRKNLIMACYLNDKSKRKRKDMTYACAVCKKSFHTKDLLKAHEVVHKKASEDPQSYKCVYCNNVYQTPESLEKHVRKCQLIRSVFRKS